MDSRSEVELCSACLAARVRRHANRQRASALRGRGKPPTSPLILARLYGVTDALIFVANLTIRLALLGGFLYSLGQMSDPAVRSRWGVRVRRWFGHPVRHRILEPLKAQWETVAAEAARRRLTHAYRNLPATTLNDPAVGDPYIATAVLVWCRAAPVRIISSITYLTILLITLLNVTLISRVVLSFTHEVWRLLTGHHTPAHASTASDDVKTLDPLSSLIEKAQSLGRWLWNRWKPATRLVDDPRHPAVEGLISFAVMLVTFWLLTTAVRVAWAHTRSLQSGPPNHRDRRHKPKKRDRHLSLTPSLLNMSTQHLPVLILLQCVERVGAAHKRWEFGHPLDAPRVTFPDAERVIWNAWKTRHIRTRRPLRRQHKEHAEEVVGALRAAEQRQHSEDDTGKVLEDIALMLLTIASRYAEGRTGELLDRSQLDGVTPATNFAWIRMLLFGGMTIAAGAACTILGVPAEAVAPAMGLVLFIGSRAILGLRLGAAETMELFRGGK